MSSFIELHLDRTPPTPCIVNKDSIAYVEPAKEGCYLYLRLSMIDGGNNRLSSHAKVIHVIEDYYTIKTMLRCL